MNNIKSERSRLGMTQGDLAHKLRVGESTIRRWEKDESSIPSEFAIRMSRLFGCSTDYLFGLCEERKGVAFHEAG